MVWKDSKKVGVAYATKAKPTKKSLCTVVVAKFDPPEDEKDFANNIRKGSFDKSFCGSVHSMAVSALDNAPPILQPTQPVAPGRESENTPEPPKTPESSETGFKGSGLFSI